MGHAFNVATHPKTMVMEFAYTRRVRKLFGYKKTPKEL